MGDLIAQFPMKARVQNLVSLTLFAFEILLQYFLKNF